MKKKLGKEFLIGISVIVAILILIFGIDYLKGINLFQPSNFYLVYYDNVAGLEVSAPVQINGYKVGQVRNISIDYHNPGKAKVTLALNKKLRLPENTTAQLGQTLLSGAFVALNLGDSKNILEVGSTLQPASEPDLMSAIQSQVLPAISQVLPKVDSLLHNLNMLTGDPALSRSIGRFDGITENLYNVSGGLNNSMISLNRSLPLILNNAGKASVNLDSITDNLAILSYQLKGLPIQPTMENVNQITENLELFSRRLNNPNSTLGLLTSDPLLYNQLNRVSADIDSLIIDIKKNPKRYINIKLL